MTIIYEGNAFLSHIHATDGIYMMLRAFEDADIVHVEGDVNPVRDIEIIIDELRMKDIETVNKALEKDRRVMCCVCASGRLTESQSQPHLFIHHVTHNTSPPTTIVAD